MSTISLSATVLTANASSSLSGPSPGSLLQPPLRFTLSARTQKANAETPAPMSEATPMVFKVVQPM
jgi:hypothetical protein